MRWLSSNRVQWYAVVSTLACLILVWATVFQDRRSVFSWKTVFDVAPSNLRVIVLTSNRPKSLEKLLSSLNTLETDGDTARLEIWIDRSLKGELDEATLNVSSNFRWTKGSTSVHVQQAHAGIYGQWINTWVPARDTREIGLILEDDLSVSPYAYRWLKAARTQYGNKPNVAGYTLTSTTLAPARGPGPIPRPKKDVVFLYKLVGSHGFAPHPKVWRDFQDWFAEVRTNKTFRPYVKDLHMTNWYKSYEKRSHETSMWTMWFIYYCDKLNLFTVHNNIAKIHGLSEGYLVEHRQEPGLHYNGKHGRESTHLLKTWNNTYIKFPNKTTYLDFDGKIAITQ